MTTHPVTRQNQRGFALLFVFALAGIAALMLYNELPRAVFESQRGKEELLVSRGQEYQRGIQLYYRKLRKYPTTIEDLEKTSGVRFLRRRYVDPFTGKDDWRLVHINASGQYTDSKVIKPPTANAKGGLSSSITADQPKEDPNDPALKRRASDTSAVEIGGNLAAAPPDPNALPPGSAPPPFQGRTVDNQTAQYNPSFGVGSSGSVGVGGVGNVGSTYPTSGVNSQTGGAIGSPIQGAGGQLIQSQNGQRPLTPEQLNPAMDVIQRLLTSPRSPPAGVIPGSAGTPSGGFGGANTTPSGNFTISGPAANGGNGQLGGGGIAGVASKHEGRGIKLINDRDRIEEWEFIYDYAKDRGGRPNSNTQSQQAGGLNNGLNNGQNGVPTGSGNRNGQNGQNGQGQGGFGGQGQGSFGGQGQGGLGQGQGPRRPF